MGLIAKAGGGGGGGALVAGWLELLLFIFKKASPLALLLLLLRENLLWLLHSTFNSCLGKPRRLSSIRGSLGGVMVVFACLWPQAGLLLAIHRNTLFPCYLLPAARALAPIILLYLFVENRR